MKMLHNGVRNNAFLITLRAASSALFLAGAISFGYELYAANQQDSAKKEIEFVILVTSFKNERYVKRNLDSLMGLRSTNPYSIIYVNDGSPDKTGELVEAYIKDHNLPESFFTLINNKERVGSALENIYNTVHNNIADKKIVVCVDGDDTLSFKGVLERLEEEYKDPDVWMTYGRFVVYPAAEFWTICGGYPEEVIRERSFRQHYNVPSHLKTFRAALFKKIKRESLLDTDGKIFRTAWDMAMLFPMLEMCAPKNPTSKNHSVFIEDTVMYVYNFDNPLNDFSGGSGRAAQIERDRYIRQQPPYEPLDTLFEEKI